MLAENKRTMPEINSVWVDGDEGSDYLYKYKGIYNKSPFKDRLHFVRFDWETGKESEGGLWIGYNRFLKDMVPTDKMAKYPCCGRPTSYPDMCCDDCHYDKWSQAKNTVSNPTTNKETL